MSDQDKMTISEKIEIIKLLNEDFRYRHTNYWSIFHKSMIAILGLISLPYMLYAIIDNVIILSLFPFLSLIISIFSIILLESEAVRMNASRVQMNNLLSSLSDNFKQLPIDTLLMNKKNKMTLYGKLLSYRITKKILFLYIVLIIISGLATYLIISQNIFPPIVTNGK